MSDRLCIQLKLRYDFSGTNNVYLKNIMKRLAKFTFLTVVVFTLGSYNLTVAAGTGSQGQPIKVVGDKLISSTTNTTNKVGYCDWDKLLKKHVNKEGLADYKGFKPITLLDHLSQEVAGCNPK
ncbi:hypothetical protein [Gelidibacter maritimus]|uniref:Uncharacterized protein n=1 Tax=Gelidibacter maritimus TaxID=2761487 RepID=A0A7W2R468_9FLAO|nr:hypothetical protein [Gelidibacter maritimus]MBA6153509.1 hypothetical protein [Gelidibacter maritimus]